MTAKCLEVKMYVLKSGKCLKSNLMKQNILIAVLFFMVAFVSCKKDTNKLPD